MYSGQGVYINSRRKLQIIPQPIPALNIVTVPNNWQTLSTYSIEYTTYALPEAELYYSLDGINYTYIMKVYAYLSSVLWTIPRGISSSVATLKIVSLDGNTYFETEPFAITDAFSFTQALPTSTINTADNILLDAFSFTQALPTSTINTADNILLDAFSFTQTIETEIV